MLYRYRYIILSALLTVVVVAACLFAPDFFLTLERRGDTGRVMHGENVYNADDISDDSISTFNFQKRLMMLSGQWKCEKEAVEPVADVLDAASLERICVSIPTLFMQDFSNIIQRNYDYWYGFIGDEINHAIDTYDQEVVTATADAAGSQESPGFNPNIPEDAIFGYAALFYGGNARLYKYTDSILSGYSFYVWDYSVDNEVLDISYDIKVDAVTLDIYSFSIHGGKLDQTDWFELLNFHQVDEIGNENNVIFQARVGIPFDIPPVTAAVLPVSYCYRMYSDYMETHISGIRAFKSGIQGYSYTTNFLQRSDMKVEAVSEGALMLTSGNETVYACIKTPNPGFHFYFTCDAPDVPMVNVY